MNKKLIRDGFEYYVEIEAPGGEDYEYQMLLVNRIDCILPVNVMTVNEKRQLIYSASGYKSLENSFEKMLISAEQILCIMESILDGADSMKKYLLSPNSLVLETECIFIDYDYKQAGLVYVPGYDRDIISQLRELMEYIIGKINHSDIKSVMLTWKLYVLLKDEHISLREIRRTLKNFREQKGLWEGQEYSLELEKRETPVKRESLLKQKSKEAPVKRESLLKQKSKEFPVEQEHSFKPGQRKQKFWQQTTILLLISVVLFLALAVTDAVFLYSIYANGITEWKRNLFLLDTFLLIVSMGILAVLWKKEKIMRTLKELQEKSVGKRP